MIAYLVALIAMLATGIFGGYWIGRAAEARKIDAYFRELLNATSQKYPARYNLNDIDGRPE